MHIAVVATDDMSHIYHILVHCHRHTCMLALEGYTHATSTELYTTFLYQFGVKRRKLQLAL